MTNQENILIGSRLKQVRTYRNITQEQLALMLSCRPSHICNVEKGISSFSVQSLAAACRCLDVSADYILFGSGPQSENALLSRILQEASGASPGELTDYLRYICYRKEFSGSRTSLKEIRD